LATDAHFELNEIDLLKITEEKTFVLKNKEKLCDLTAKGLMKEENMEPDYPIYLNYWNGGKTYEQCREVLFVRLKSPNY